jgi:hypothetical protein
MGKQSPQRDSQHDKFIGTARELDCDEDQEAFSRAVRQLATSKKPAPLPSAHRRAVTNRRAKDSA